MALFPPDAVTIGVRDDLPNHELKKHVGAVHVKGRLTLLQRKVSNVLLLNAYEDLPRSDVFEHTIRIRTLAEATGFDSNDHEYLREALEALVDLKVKWNVLSRDGEEEWGVSSFLAQAVTKGGVCRYAYAPDLRKKLFNPEIYARINLAIQERFGSSYALALYENCVRFRKVGTTGWIGIDDWRGLLGVEDGQYEEFKYLNRSVLKPAIKEVNGHSDIRVSMERKREGRRVAALKFAVTENHQLALELRAERATAGALGGRALPDPRDLAPEPEAVVDAHRLGPLQRRLMAFGLTEAQAIDTSTEFDRERIEGNLAYVEGELERGRALNNVAAFTLTAIREDYRPQEVPVVERVKARRARKAAATTDKAGRRSDARQRRAQAEAEERERAQARADRLDAVYEALSRSEQEAVDAAAVERLRTGLPFLYRTYEGERRAGTPLGEMSVAVRSTLRAHRYDLLEGEEAPRPTL